MIRCRMSLTCGFALLILAAAPGGQAALGSKDEPKAQRPTLFPDDARLAKRVRADRARVYLGELLEIASGQCGVSLKVDESGGALDGVELSAFLRDRPAREVLVAIDELLTTPFHRCEWRKEGSGYILRHYPSLADASEAARRALASEWFADVRFAHELAQLAEPERRLRAATRNSLFGPAGPPPRLGVLSKLSASDLEAVLRGATVPLDMRKLTPDDHEALKLGLSDGGGNPRFEPLAPAFYVSWESDRLGPMLMLRNQAGVSGNVVGGVGWDARWQDKHNQEWVGRLSPEVDEFYRRRVRNDPGVGNLVSDRRPPELIKRAAHTHGVSIIADLVLPGNARDISGCFIGLNITQSMQHLVLSMRGTWKDLGMIQLIRDQATLVHPRDHLVPWKQIRSWRSACDQNDEYLTLDALTEMAELTAPQRQGLNEEFPDARANLLHRWRPIFRFYSHLDRSARRRLLSAEGLAWRDAGVVARAAFAETAPPEFGPRKDGEPAPPPIDDGVRGLPLLAEFSNQAIVRLEMKPAELGMKDGKLQKVKALFWTVRVPNQKQHEARQVLVQRRPLKPE